MPVTVRGTDILFNDGTTQGTAGGAPTTAQVLAATAAASGGGVGTYAFLIQIGGIVSPAHVAGSTEAGSNLRFVGILFFTNVTGNAERRRRDTSPFPSGTWRCMGFSPFSPGYSSDGETCTLWLRIS